MRAVESDTDAPESRASSDATAGAVVRRRHLDIATVLAAGALALSTSDRFLTARRASLTIKPSYLLFAAALAFGLGGGGWARLVERGKRLRAGAAVLAATAVLYVLATLAGPSVSGGVKQLVTIGGGAAVPCLALLCVAHRGNAAVLLRWYIGGTLLACAYGLYQLAAFYEGWPQGIIYVGTAGAVGRISSFAYEPAYFGVSLTVLVPLLLRDAVVDERRMHRRVPGWVPFVAVVIVAFLVNARSLYFSVPVALAVGWMAFVRRDRRGARRALAIATVSLAVGFLVFVTAAAWRNGSFGEGLATAGQRGQSVADTEEEASNAPRIEIYRHAVRVIRKHPLLGLGPGRGFDHGLVEIGAKDRSLLENPPDRAAIVNNVWLQAAVDAGVLAPLLGALFCGWLAQRWWRHRRSPGGLLAAGGLIVVMVNGLLISFQWDLRVWAAIGLGLALLVDERTPEPGVASP